MVTQTPDAELEERLALLAQCGFFDRLNRGEKAEVVDELDVVLVYAGTPLFSQGDPGDGMYIVDRGLLEVRATMPDGRVQVLDRLDPGESVGEMALITGRPRSADVIAVVDSRLVRLSKSGFDRLAARHPALLNGFAWAMSPRVQRTQLASILGRLFDELDPLALRDLQEQLVWRRIPAGQRLFAQGDAGASMFIVVSGRLQFVHESGSRAADGPEAILGEVGAGETIGEFSLLTDEPRSASVFAVRDTDLVELPRPVFEGLVRQHPEFMAAIARGIARRQQRALGIGLSAPVAINIALVSADGVDREAFARVLADSLGDSRVFTPAGFDQAFGRAGAANLDADDPLSLVINGWLRDQAGGKRALVFVADAGLSNWTSRCLGQADRVLVLRRADSQDTLTEAERAIPDRTRRDLVLLADASHSAVGDDGLQRRSWPNGHVFLVRDGAPDDIEALGRSLTEPDTGTALVG